MRTVRGVTLECLIGDIAVQHDVTAIVNAANANLTMGGGVAGAIHRAAGPGLAEECRPLAPIQPGAAVITTAHHLPNRYVIHCLGPVYGLDEPAAELLASCYHNAIRLAEQTSIETIAFPAISTGAFGYPFEEATLIALRTTVHECPRLRTVRRIRFVLMTSQALATYETVLAALLDVRRMDGPA